MGTSRHCLSGAQGGFWVKGSYVLVNRSELTSFEKFISLFTTVRPGEGRSVAWLLLHAFLLMCAYYLVRTTRETFILTEGSAALRSYASGIQAALLIFILPLYGMLFRLQDKSLLIQRINFILAFSLIPFFIAHQMGFHIGFVLFIWTGIMAVMVTSQFWAFATDLLNPKTGQRLFAVIGMGVSLGALFGTILARHLLDLVGADGLLIVAAFVFLSTLPLSKLSNDSVPIESRPPPLETQADTVQKMFGGLALVLKDRYLISIAALVVLLNWSGATGEFVLNDFIKDASMAMPAVDREIWIGKFQAGVMFWVTLLSAVFQLLFVSRIIIKFGIRVALAVSPAIFVVSYMAMGLLPLLAVTRWAVIAVKSLDYSLLTPCRNALLLPTSRTVKYEGKTAIDTLFFRAGDLLSAFTVLIGVEFLRWGHNEFIIVNIVLATCMLVVSLFIGKSYAQRIALPEFNSAPFVGEQIPDATICSGRCTHHVIPPNAFLDDDAGEVLTIRAELHCGSSLPAWVRLDKRRHVIEATPPMGHREELVIRVIATDYDGLFTSQTFRLIIED